MEQTNPNTAEFKDRTQYEHTRATSCLVLGVLVESRLFPQLVSQCDVTLSLSFRLFFSVHAFDGFVFNKSGGVLGISAATAGLEPKVKRKERCIPLPWQPYQANIRY